MKSLSTWKPHMAYCSHNFLLKKTFTVRRCLNLKKHNEHDTRSSPIIQPFLPAEIFRAINISADKTKYFLTSATVPVIPVLHCIYLRLEHRRLFFSRTQMKQNEQKLLFEYLANCFCHNI